MATSAIIMLILGLLSAAATATGIGLNYSQQEKTNKQNVQLTHEANASNVEQANLAYQRSLPINQVKNLQDAGYSKIGALHALSGAGSYTAAPIQSAQVQSNPIDLASIGSSLDRLNNVPANAEQFQLIQAQRKALAVDTQNKLNQEKRNQELHEFNLWRQGYDKNTAIMLDNASSKVANALIDSGKTIQDYKDFESMIRGLGLDKDKDIRNITHIARQQLEDGVRSKFDTERARQSQANANRSADDAHSIALRHKVQLDQQIQDFDAAKDARNKEYKAREFAATLESMASEQGIAFKDLDNTIKFYRDDNGVLHVHPVEGISKDVQEFWDVLFTFVPVKPLAEILSRIFVK